MRHELKELLNVKIRLCPFTEVALNSLSEVDNLILQHKTILYYFAEWIADSISGTEVRFSKGKLSWYDKLFPFLFSQLLEQWENFWTKIFVIFTFTYKKWIFIWMVKEKKQTSVHSETQHNFSKNQSNTFITFLKSPLK